jgi:hAT family C-terminal dimerisation region
MLVFAKTAAAVLGPLLDASSAAESPAEELQRYLQEKHVEEEQNLLLWWKHNQACFPNLAQMA